MPRILKIVEQHIFLQLPRVRGYLRRHGLLKTLWRLSLVPVHIVRSYRQTARLNSGMAVTDDFDREHNVETSLRVAVTDLDVKSANWIYAEPYWPTPCGLLEEALEGLGIHFEDFTFIDLGSGKGRVLLLASELPFRQIVGVELSSQLHAVAQRNIASYNSSTQRCRDITSACMDFTEFRLPAGPLVVFLYNPAFENIIRTVAARIRRSWNEHPREIWIVNVAGRYNVFDLEPGFTKLRMSKHLGYPYQVYRTTDSRSISILPEMDIERCVLDATAESPNRGGVDD